MNDPNPSEEIARLSNRAMYANKFEGFRRRQRGFWLAFRECCGKCEGGGFVENILTGVTAVRTDVESGDYRPDVLLEREGKPPLWVEFGPPPTHKLAYCAAHGIDLFVLDGNGHPEDAGVITAHISPRNCRERRRQRIFDLWERMRRHPDPVIGIREDFRRTKTKQREAEELLRGPEETWEAVSQGKIRCVRGDKPYQIENGGFSIQYVQTHRPNEECGEYPMGLACEFAIAGMGADDGTEWHEWQLKEGCPTCQPLIDEVNRMVKDSATRQPLRSVVMPAPYGTRVVQEPERRTQECRVGGGTVSREELQAVLILIELVLPRFRPAGWALLSDQVDGILDAVQFASNLSSGRL